MKNILSSLATKLSAILSIRPGRNLAVIVESAAINYRAKKMGYNAAQELYNRVTGSLSTNKEEQKEQI